MSIAGTTPSAPAERPDRDAVASWAPSEHPRALVGGADGWLEA